ncbi:MAG: HAD hydrolase family protein [Vicinamibacterales bacterium]
MKLSAIALDYDGTIARNDVLSPDVRHAISVLRTKGILVMLVTGRILDELRRVAGSLHFVDAVIAENGAVVHYPDKGITSALAPPVPDAMLAEIRRRGIPFRNGLSIVDTRADEAPHLLDIIRALELPWVLAFNAGQVMVLPQGVSKATGLKLVLDRQRVSARNTLAIGDAENDHEMLRLAEVGVAVAWGSAVLRQAADLLAPGDGPDSVAPFLLELSESGVMPPVSRARRHLFLGHTDEGREFSLAVRGRNVLVAGDPRSGKSWVAGLLCEQLIAQGYCVCVIDPEGDYRSLEGLPGVTVLGGDDPPPSPRELLRALRYPDRSVVVDLSQRSHEEKVEYVRALLPALNVLRRRTGLPHRIIIDEAHYYLHDDNAEALLDLRQNGYTVISYCASRLPASLLAATEVIIVTCESNPYEIDALFERCRGCAPMDRHHWDQLTHLPIGRAVALPVTEESGGKLRAFTIAPRLTPHVRHRQKYVDMPIGPQRAFVFGRPGSPAPVQTLRAFVVTVEGMAPALLGPYIVRGDFSRWIEDVFGDRALAHEIRGLEQGGRGADHLEIGREIVAAIRARYDLLDEEGVQP